MQALNDNYTLTEHQIYFMNDLILF